MNQRNKIIGSLALAAAPYVWRRTRKKVALGAAVGAAVVAAPFVWRWARPHIQRRRDRRVDAATRQDHWEM